MIRPLASTRSRLSLALLPFSLLVDALAGLAVVTHRRAGPMPSSVGGPFALVDQNGTPVTDAAFKGKPFIVFFGYTHCPDICPTVLNDATAMLNALGKSEPVSVLFITVDPARDTPRVLKDYLSSFDPRITGLTGDAPAIEAVEHAYRVYAKKVPETNGVDYSMSHTAVVYLMDKEGRFVNALNLEQPPQAAAEEFRKDL